MKISYILFAISILTNNLIMSQITFQKSFGGNAMDEAKSVRKTSDGGYIIAGTTTSFGSGGRDVLVIKTNSFGDTIWTRTYGGASDNEYGFCVQQTSDGGYVVSGIAASFADVGGDMYLIKLKQNGDTSWTRTYGGIGYEGAAFVQQTTDGGYILTGQTPAIGAGMFDVYLLKLNQTGNIQWTKTYGSVGTEYGNAVQQTTDGGYIITGSNDNSTGFGASDFYLIKTDAVGNLIWTKTYGREGFEEGVAVRQTADGGYIIAGTSELTLGPLGPDMCLIKTNSVGDTLWAKLYGGPFIDECYDVRQTTDGGYVMVGKSFSFSNSGDYDVYVVKVNSIGNVIWSKNYGASGSNLKNEIGYSIQQTNDGGFIISGETMSGFGIGLKNIYLIKTDSIGNSGCNQTAVVTLTSNLSPQVATPQTSVASGGSMLIPATQINSGTVPTNICTSVSTTNLELQTADKRISIYPNPFQNTIVICTHENASINKIVLKNILGLEVFSKTYLGNLNTVDSINLDLQLLVSGIYLCSIELDGQVQTYKVQKL